MAGKKTKCLPTEEACSSPRLELQPIFLRKNSREGLYCVIFHLYKNMYKQRGGVSTCTKRRGCSPSTGPYDLANMSSRSSTTPRSANQSLASSPTCPTGQPLSHIPPPSQPCNLGGGAIVTPTPDHIEGRPRGEAAHVYLACPPSNNGFQRQATRQQLIHSFCPNGTDKEGPICRV